MTPDLTLDNNATKIRIRLITDIDYVTDTKKSIHNDMDILYNCSTDDQPENKS